MEHSEAWIGLHSFLGNDYTPTFYGKGKLRPINFALKDTKFIKVFSSLGSIPLEQQIFEEIERYVCIIYGSCMGTCNINKVIKSIFEEKLGPAVSPHPSENIKSTDPTMFAPRNVILEQQTKLAWFITDLYKTPVEVYAEINHTPIDFDWELDRSNSLKVTKFHLS